MKQGRIEFNAYFLIIVTLILFSLFAVRLYGTLDEQEVKIGEKQEAMIDTHERTELMKLAFRLATKQSTNLATREFIRSGGLLQADCGTTGNYVNWNTPDSSCVPTLEYETYYTLLDRHLREPLQQFDTQYSTDLSTKDYAYYIDDMRVVGIADRPEAIPITTKNEPIPITLLGIPISSVDGGVQANVGWYHWQPHFEVTTNTGILDISRIRTLFNSIQEHCKLLSRANQTNCIEHQATVSGIDAQIDIADNQYYQLRIPSTAGPTGTGAPYRIGIYVEPLAQA